MPDETTAVQWAREHARYLAGEVGRRRGLAAENKAAGAAAVEFLRRYAPDTHFYIGAAEAFADGRGQSVSEALLQLIGMLEGWADFVEAGFTTTLPFGARARIEAATDLLEQVQTLLDDASVVPAAPVMLAGAALEELLRSLVLAHEATVKGKPGLTTYAEALRVAGVLSPQDVKDVIAWAGQRNEAAHGHFEALSRPRAQIMVDGINLFMRQKSPAAGDG